MPRATLKQMEAEQDVIASMAHLGRILGEMPAVFPDSRRPGAERLSAGIDGIDWEELEQQADAIARHAANLKRAVANGRKG